MASAAAVALACAFAPDPAAAQATSADRLVISVSQPQVSITSTFTGAELVVFGVAETIASDTTPDVVVTVRGPKQSFVTWRKSRLFGLWVNTDSRTFIDVPAFLSVQSNRPPDEMAPPAVLRDGQIGLSRNALTQLVGTDYADVVPTDPFRQAFLRTQQAANLYQEDSHGVTFLAPRVFRANFTIPGQAPIGRYDVAIQLLRDGKITARAVQHFEVNRSGFEQDVATFSQTEGTLYGITVAIGSLIVGFIGNFLFRKE
ncbi:TIGR02186 family protein [Xanthobacter agilis]|jgi:uncharacterized protein (TIGR02186 family)|uniref:Uncharacterized protein (TIGR02186 family) n=1 Tax=Xanthobacter agilis TaxID=47492 RepID=A0ABU0L9W3_XANAG|nr:TIGR02186 family protein [Xanthobacter agilis]MDQ0503932.1 uncharacterized protein (TIGR02186 family) [Xanthobacter agilis]